MIEVPVVIREVQGIPEESFLKLQSDVTDQLSRRHINQNGTQSLKAGLVVGEIALLPTLHLRHFWRTHEISALDTDIEGLVEHLDTKLDNRFDKTLEVPAIPTSVAIHSHKKRGLIVGQAPQLTTEQQVVRGEVESFYNVEPAYGNWPAVRPLRGYTFAQVTHALCDDVIDVVQMSLENDPDFQAATVVYKPISIEVNTVSES